MNTIIGIFITIVIALAIGDYLDKNYGETNDKKSEPEKFDLDKRRPGYQSGEGRHGDNHNDESLV